jgi:hypothetical protein
MARHETDVKQTNDLGESTSSVLPPFSAAKVHASVVLVPPLADGTEVQEKITSETAADMQRYVQLADKLLDSDKKEKSRETEAASNAA